MGWEVETWEPTWFCIDGQPLSCAGAPPSRAPMHRRSSRRSATRRATSSASSSRAPSCRPTGTWATRAGQTPLKLFYSDERSRTQQRMERDLIFAARQPAGTLLRVLRSKSQLLGSDRGEQTSHECGGGCPRCERNRRRPRAPTGRAPGRLRPTPRRRREGRFRGRRGRASVDGVIGRRPGCQTASAGRRLISHAASSPPRIRPCSLSEDPLSAVARSRKAPSRRARSASALLQRRVDRRSSAAAQFGTGP